MKSLFTDIYNKIMDWFQIERGENTSECAANRLQVILMHDRTKLDPLIMSKMREELIEVFSKYVVIDKEELEIGLKNEGDAVALMLNIPVVRAKTEEELNELRKKLQEEETKVKDDDENENEENSEESKDNADSDKVTEETKDNTEKAETKEEAKTVEAEIVEEKLEEKPEKESVEKDVDSEKDEDNIVEAEKVTEITKEEK